MSLFREKTPRTVTQLEERFSELLEHLRSSGVTNLQRHLKGLEADEVPEAYRAALSFWSSLSGSSRNLMFDTAQGRRLGKKF